MMRHCSCPSSFPTSLELPCRCVRLPASTAAAAIAALSKAASCEGLEIYWQRRIGVEGGAREVWVVGVCSESLLSEAMAISPRLGVLLPCSVVVAEMAGYVEVSCANPLALFSLVEDDVVETLVAEADRRLGSLLVATRARACVPQADRR